MPSIKEFVSTNTYRPENSGYNAFETLGRRVGGQYDQAGNDLRDIGRAKAAVTNMLGRWPFNIIELEQRAAEQAAVKSKPSSGGFSIGGFYSGGGRSRRSPSYAAFNQMSEGAGALGQMLRGPATSTPSDRDGYSAQTLRERDRQAQLDAAASEKRWDLYEKNLNEYNKDLNDTTQEWYDKQGLTEEQYQQGATEARVEDVITSPAGSPSTDTGNDSYTQQGGGTSWWPF